MGAVQEDVAGGTAYIYRWGQGIACLVIYINLRLCLMRSLVLAQVHKSVDPVFAKNACRGDKPCVDHHVVVSAVVLKDCCGLRPLLAVCGKPLKGCSVIDLTHLPSG